MPSEQTYSPGAAPMTRYEQTTWSPSRSSWITGPNDHRNDTTNPTAMPATITVRLVGPKLGAPRRCLMATPPRGA